MLLNTRIITDCFEGNEQFNTRFMTECVIYGECSSLRIDKSALLMDLTYHSYYSLPDASIIMDAKRVHFFHHELPLFPYLLFTINYPRNKDKANNK